ncbi:hypothetical protein [Paracoccus sp. (in: a-proteobacteria)]|uniref:hypothetical protein n=1 Tax=Paracoccus sp. TaxID=267 RepID=UPI003A890339
MNQKLSGKPGAVHSNNEMAVQALFAGASNTSGIIREVGLFLADGTLFALYAGEAIGERLAGEDYVFAETIVLAGISLDRVSFIAAAPNVDILIVGPFAQISAEIIRLQRRAVETENLRLTPLIAALSPHV